MSRTLRKLRLFILSFVSGLLLFTTTSYAFSTDDPEILKLSAREQAAVIRSADGELRLVRVGDRIGADGQVLQIDSHVLVIRETRNGRAATVIIRLEDGRQTISTVKDIGDKRPALHQTLQTGRETRR